MRLPASLIDEVFGQIKIPLLVCRPVQLDQCQLDFFVAAVTTLLAWIRAKHRRDVINIPPHHVEKLAFTGRLKVSDCAFEHVPGAIEFVLVAEVCKAVHRLDHGKMGVQVTVRLLRRGNQINHVVGTFLQLGIGMRREAERRGFDPFAHVRIPENVWFIGLAMFPLKLERINAASVLALFVLNGQCRLAINLHQPSPKSAINPHLCQRCRK